MRDTPLTFPAADLLANDEPGPANESAQTLIVTSVDAGAGTHGTVALAGGAGHLHAREPATSAPRRSTYRACDDGQTAGAADPRCADGTVDVTVGGRRARRSIAVTPADAVDRRRRDRAVHGDRHVQRRLDARRHRRGRLDELRARGRERHRRRDRRAAASRARRRSPRPRATSTATPSLTVTAAPAAARSSSSRASHTMLAGDTQALHATGVLVRRHEREPRRARRVVERDAGVATIDADGTGDRRGRGHRRRSAPRSARRHRHGDAHRPAARRRRRTHRPRRSPSPGDDAEVTEPDGRRRHGDRRRTS